MRPWKRLLAPAVGRVSSWHVLLVLAVVAPAGFAPWTAAASSAASSKGHASSPRAPREEVGELASPSGDATGQGGGLTASLEGGGLLSLGGGRVETVGQEAGGPVATAPPPALTSFNGPFGADSGATRAETPEQESVDRESRRAYRGLDRAGAVGVARRVFHVEDPSWSAPGTAPGRRVVDYLSAFAASEEVRHGKQVLVQSTLPLEVDDGSGKMTPVSVTLHQRGGVYVPANPLVPLAISRRVAGGATLPAGITVAPSSAASGEAPEVLGNRVLWANAERDTDFISEPAPGGIGLEDSWQLRSEDSPQENGLVFKLPAGAVLRMSSRVPGDAEVVQEDTRLALIPAASARTADGRSIPVRYSVRGDTLMTHVNLTGNVDFPVLVDPIVIGYYGSGLGGGWYDWHEYSNCGCFSFEETSSALWLGANVGPGEGSYGEWYDGVPISRLALVTRVDVTGLYHEPENQATLNIGIWGSNGTEEYSENGFAGTNGPAPLRTNRLYSNQAMAICADGAGGNDYDDPQPLCNENYGGEGFWFADDLLAWRNAFNYSEIASATIRYEQSAPPVETDPETRVQAKWYTSAGEQPFVKGKGEDKGVGVREAGIDLEPGLRRAYGAGGSEMPDPGSAPAPGTSTYAPGCADPWCDEWLEYWDTISGLSSGVWTAGLWSRNGVGLNAEETIPIYVDNTKPTIQTPSWNNATFNEGAHTLTFSAKDGTADAPASGVRQIHLYVDGVYVANDFTKCPEPVESNVLPPEECFSLTGSWTLQGEDIGAGPHTVTIWAENWVGATSEESFQITVNHAVGDTEQVGPGTLNLRSGNYTLGATDVSVAAGAATLSVARTYDSQSKEPAGPLGPGWLLSTPDTSGGGQWQSLQELPEGRIEVTMVGGQKLVFAPNASEGFTSPTGYETYTLSEPIKSPATYRITDPGGDFTQFTKPSGASAFLPTTAAQAIGQGGLNKVTYIEREGKTSEIIGPEPPEVKCEPNDPEGLPRGCRALTLHYAKTTSASGEAPSAWGNYEGHLESVSLTAWKPAKGEPTKGEMKTVTVAKYAYDKQGRLRAEWNPQVEESSDCKGTCAPLKTIYGYDSEDHVTALTPPGQETWAFIYGKIRGDESAGRLLKVMQAPASKECKTGCSVVAPGREQAPALSGTVVTGNMMAVSNGVWSNEPVAYAYQWEDCNGSGEECTPILGATNGNYTPTGSDVAHTLVAKVTATNGGGSVTVSSGPSAVVTESHSPYRQTVEDNDRSLNAVSCIPGTTDCVASDSVGNAFYATNVGGPGGTSWNAWTGPSGESPSQAVDCPTTTLCVLADGKETAGGKLYYATSLGGSFTEAYSPTYGVDAISCPSAGFCVDGQDGDGYFRYSTSPASSAWTLEEQGTTAMKGAFCLSSSFCALANGAGTVYVATSASQIESSTWTASNVDGVALNAIACTSTTSCVAVDGRGYLLNLAIEGGGLAKQSLHDIDASNDLTDVTCTGAATCVAVDNVGDVFISTNAGETWSKPYDLEDDLTSVSCASASLCAATDTTGHIATFNPAAAPTAGEQRPPQPGWTVEYDAGSPAGGLPGLNVLETGKWGETDNPVQATAIFPPDEPQGWPASNYRRASISYFDSAGRLVNSASPGGGISTTQYESYDNVEWSLTAENRQRALESSETTRTAEHLETKNSYENQGSELQSTLGPQHEVKLPNGAIVQARAQTKYYYEEGAPANGGPYGLVTKATEGALLEDGEEADTRTIKTSYSGQSNLGWQLHKPTSVTVEPESGKPLTRTTVYSSETGDVTETKGQAQASGITPQPVYALKFGTEGSEAGQLKEPHAVAITGKGDVLVLDSGNSRIESYNSAGRYEKRFGSAGSGDAQFSAPLAMTEADGGEILVADTGNNRIEKFNDKYKFLDAFGFGVSNGEDKLETCKKKCRAGISGSAAGQFKGPQGIAVTPAGNIFVVDTGNNRIEEFNKEDDFVAAYGFGVSNGESKPQSCTTTCQAGIAGPGNGQFNHPSGVAATSAGAVWVTDTSNHRIEEFSETGEYLAKVGSQGTGNGQFEEPTGIAIGPGGTLFVSDDSSEDVQEFSSSGGYLTSFGVKGTANGQFEEPYGLVITSSSQYYVVDAKSDRVQEWVPGDANVHDKQTIYYSTAADAQYPECGKHPEWVGLPCLKRPAAQPISLGLPKLPETTVTYNIWDEVETTTVKGESATRTSTESYDPAGRPTESAVTSSTGKRVPPVIDGYSPTTGALVAQSTDEGGAQELKSEFNTLGQLVSYTDAAGIASTYEYDEDGRIVKFNDGKGTQSFEYSETSGLLTALKDSEAGDFSATYNVEGQLTSETYPNGMTATYADNAVGQTTAVSYAKGAAIWYKDQIYLSIHGQTLAQQSTLANDNYTYDNTGRLTMVQEEPLNKVQEEAVGKGCKTTLFGYDAESNRVSETTREPGTGGVCAGEGGTTTVHTYDEADRLVDPGVAYEPLGANTSLPAADAGGHALESSYYASGALYSQIQGEQTNSYTLDPAGRVLETATTKNTSTKTMVSNYPGTGTSVSWTESEGSWTRNITGISGATVATSTNGAEPAIQLANLHGDIVGSAADNSGAETATLRSEPTAFGVPTSNVGQQSGWLGSGGVETAFDATGITASSSGAYVPQLGLRLEPEELTGAAAQDPPNEYGINAALAEPTSYATSKQPGVIEPPAVNEQIEREWHEHPGWMQEPENEEEGEEGEEGEGGDPVARIAVRAKTPEGRFAEAKCDKERDNLENHGYRIGNFTGQLQSEPGGRYEGTSYELLYATEFAVIASAPKIAQQSTCHVIVSGANGRYRVTHGPHFRIGQGLSEPYT